MLSVTFRQGQTCNKDGTAPERAEANGIIRLVMLPDAFFILANLMRDEKTKKPEQQITSVVTGTIAL